MIKNLKLLSLVLFGACSALTAAADAAPQDLAHVSKLELSVTDGSAPWDTTDNVGGLLDPTTGGYQTPSSPGNDDGPNNGRVRTFDTVTFDLGYELTSNDGWTELKTTYLHYRFVLPVSSEEAVWVTDAMGWLQADGFTVTEEEVDGKTVQVLSGRRQLKGSADEPVVVPGSGTLNAIVKVMNMKNGDTIQPTFSAWLEGNCTDGTCPDHNRNEVVTAQSRELTVTAAPKYNVLLRSASSMYHSKYGFFDFNTGETTALDYGRGRIEGKSMGIGVTLQLYNDYADKKLKGIELPEGPISVEIELKTLFEPEVTSGTATAYDVSTDFAPLVWAAGAHNYSSQTGGNGRNLAVNGNQTSMYSNAGPLNKFVSTLPNASCYQGGNWSAVKSGNTVTFTVTDYAFDMNQFPSDVTGGKDGQFYTRDESLADKGVKNIGCFSAGYILVVVPWNNLQTGQSVLKQFQASGGTFYLDTKDVNMTASGRTLRVVSPTDVSRLPQPPAGNANQMVTTDDSLHASISMSVGQAGSISTSIYYSDVNEADGMDVNGRKDFVTTGEDSVVEGQSFSVRWSINNTTWGFDYNRTYARKGLLKFDPQGLELDGDGSPCCRYSESDMTSRGVAIHYLYAVKPDGSTWVDDDEMQDARIENLRYYASLEEIPSGYTCVGILFEENAIGRIDSVTSQINFVHRVLFKAKAGAARRETYMVCVEGRVWRICDYEASDLNFLSDVPSVAGLTTISLPTASGSFAPRYTKAWYDEGGYAGGHTGNVAYGDSLLITKYRTGVSIDIEQKDRYDEQKKYYDMDLNQRVVDYILQPSLLMGTGDAASGLFANVLTVSCTLPPALAYREGSAVLGGVYVPNDELGQQGSVSNGTPLEPTVTAGEDGSRILTWTFHNVPADAPIAPIHFSCDIGTPGVEETDVENGESVEVAAVARGESDVTVLSQNMGNLSKVGFQVSKLKAASLSEFAETPVVDPADDLVFTLKTSNIGENEDSFVLVNTLPYDGDPLGSHFSGTVTVGSLSIADFSSKASWTLYYTTSEDIRDCNLDEVTAEDLAAGRSVLDVDGQPKTIAWKTLTYDTATGAVTGFAADDIPTAIVFSGNLKANETLKATLTLHDAEKGPGDLFCNKLSSGTSWTSAREFVITRSIEGVVWNDDDENGAREASETLFTGISVVLTKLVGGAYEPVLDGANNPVTCAVGNVRNLGTGEETPGEAGHYRFTGLGTGTYGVRITGDGWQNISDYVVTAFEAEDVPEQINNDATGTYAEHNLLQADIVGVEMPTKEQLVQLRMSQYVASRDAGLYERSYTVTYHVAGDPVYGLPTGGGAPDPLKKIHPHADVDLAAMPTTSLSGALDPVGRQELIYGRWTIGAHWSTDSGSAESGYISMDRIENINRNYDVYAQWTFTPQAVALWIVDHEECGNGRCYLAIEPQFQVAEDIRDWIKWTREHGQFFVKYGRTRQACEDATPVQAFARDHRSETGSPAYADCDPGERDVAKGWVWIQVDLPSETVAPIGFWRVQIKQIEKTFVYGGRVKTVYVDDATGKPIPGVEPDLRSLPNGTSVTAPAPRQIAGYTYKEGPAVTSGVVETDKEIVFTYRYTKTNSL